LVTEKIDTCMSC